MGDTTLQKSQLIPATDDMEWSPLYKLNKKAFNLLVRSHATDNTPYSITWLTGFCLRDIEAMAADDLANALRPLRTAEGIMLTTFVDLTKALENACVNKTLTDEDAIGIGQLWLEVINKLNANQLHTALMYQGDPYSQSSLYHLAASLYAALMKKGASVAEKVITIWEALVEKVEPVSLRQMLGDHRQTHAENVGDSAFLFLCCALSVANNTTMNNNQVSRVSKLLNKLVTAFDADSLKSLLLDRSDSNQLSLEYLCSATFTNDAPKTPEELTEITTLWGTIFTRLGDQLPSFVASNTPDGVPIRIYFMVAMMNLLQQARAVNMDITPVIGLMSKFINAIEPGALADTLLNDFLKQAHLLNGNTAVDVILDKADIVDAASSQETGSELMQSVLVATFDAFVAHPEVDVSNISRSVRVAIANQLADWVINQRQYGGRFAAYSTNQLLNLVNKNTAIGTILDTYATPGQVGDTAARNNIKTMLADQPRLSSHSATSFGGATETGVSPGDVELADLSVCRFDHAS